MDLTELQKEEAALLASLRDWQQRAQEAQTQIAVHNGAIGQTRRWIQRLTEAAQNGEPGAGK